MMFKRMMVLSAMASALAFAGCEDRTRSGEDVGTGGAGVDQPQQAPDTGGSGRTDTIPGSTDTMGGVKQGPQGTDLGGTGAQGGGALDDTDSTGGSGLEDDKSGTGGSDKDTR